MFFSNEKAKTAWQSLTKHVESLQSQKLSSLFQHNTNRAVELTFSVDGLALDLSFNHIDVTTISHFAELGKACGVQEMQEKMFRGDKINITENRAVLHTALRKPKGSAPVCLDGQDVLPVIWQTQDKMRGFVEAVRKGTWRGATGKQIQTIVNIGIGGSDLGPRLVVEALRDYVTTPRARFVANIDACDLLEALEDLNPETTLFLIVSKTFSTEETLENARSARAWLVASLGEEAVAKHFVAVSTNIQAVESFGIHKDNIFPMWDWVGGRYSLWSAVGLSVALVTGWENFEDLLKGAARIDRHIQEEPLDQNIPFLLAMTGLMYRNIWNTTSQAILPYSHRLRSLPNYLQQADMESNGKSINRQGDKIETATAPVLFGGCGTIFQHSFGQLLQQGTDIVPVDFIGVACDEKSPPHHHQALLANMRAQAKALRDGREVSRDPARTNPGNRPCSQIMLDHLDPQRLGMLIAMYEHKIFYQGVIWNLNSYDQFGVELGKILAKEESKFQTRPVLSNEELAGYFGFSSHHQIKG